MRRSILAGLSMVALALIGANAAPGQGEGDIAAPVVKYDVLKETIVKNRGKVVLVDFWAFL